MNRPQFGSGYQNPNPFQNPNFRPQATKKTWDISSWSTQRKVIMGVLALMLLSLIVASPILIIPVAIYAATQVFKPQIKSMPKKNQNILYPVAFIFSFFIALAGLGMAVGEGEAGAADNVPVVTQETQPGATQEDATAPTLTRAQQRELDRQAEDAAQLAQAIADERCFSAPRALRDECDTAVAENRAALAEARMAAAILTGNCRALPTGREERECREQVEANQAVVDAELSAALYEQVAPLLENQVFVNAVYAPRWQVTGQRAHGGCRGANFHNETCNRNHQHSHALIFSHNENLTAEVTLENNRVRVRIPGGVALVREFLENEDIATTNTMTSSTASQVVVTS